MSKFSKHTILSNKGKFILFLTGIYIAVVTVVLPYGVLPSLAISTMVPLSVWMIAYSTYYKLLPLFMDNHKKRINKHYFIPLSLLLIGTVMAFVWIYLRLLYNTFNLPLDSFPEKYSQLPSIYFLTYIFVCIFYGHNQHHEGMNKIMEEKKELEMKILKSQINSHFLHNALNNIYSMIYFGNKDDAAKYVMKLSQMLRYVLDDCEADYVPISGEIKYIENFIDFQKSRFETAKNVTFNYVKRCDGEVLIPPMTFQPLIENCFKHCPLQDNDSFIHVEIIVGKSEIKYVSANTRARIKQSADMNSNGIGIENLKNRLHLNYKDDYSLSVSDKGDVYKTELVIYIK